MTERLLPRNPGVLRFEITAHHNTPEDAPSSRQAAADDKGPALNAVNTALTAAQWAGRQR